MSRKELVQKLGDYLGVKPKYLSAPTFAYEIVTEEESYRIDREGTITKATGEVITIEEILNPPAPEVEPDQGAEQQESSQSPMENPNLLPFDCMEVKIPFADHSGTTLRNLINMLYSKEHLIRKAFEVNEPLMDATFAEDLSQYEIKSLEDLERALKELGRDRYPALDFDFTEKTYAIKLVTDNLTPERIAAFQDLIALVHQQAQKQKRASFKQVQEENPKYAFRTWLIRIGMIGSDYKKSRKVLTEKLAGNGAFRKPTPPSKIEGLLDGVLEEKEQAAEATEEKSDESNT
ncbi:virulence-related protein [Heliorestis convoluta]|uniref:Virulence-related protein n=1 Tax=Heliorestis convoluta TaxID=356322 RepID=A0A5Q2MXJ5_9FIRM|nr:virulence-related protein [Heliorestis convoluta]QGG47338.1 Virulence-related protein [Heliorestis convoluta]